MQLFKKTLHILLFAFLMASFSLHAQPPQLINYQGKLIKDGKPVAGQVTITFAIYADSIGGSALWTETQSNVSLTKGIFNVKLGSSAAFTADLFTSAGERWLGIKAGSDAEMTPRFRLASVAYALNAGQAESVPDGSITTSKISTNGASADQVLTYNGSSIGWAKQQDDDWTKSDTTTYCYSKVGIYTRGSNSALLSIHKPIYSVHGIVQEGPAYHIFLTRQAWFLDHYYTRTDAYITTTGRVYFNGSVGIGTEDPQGMLDVNGEIYQRGIRIHADYVFEPNYQLESIREHARFMWRNKHLKAIPKAEKDKEGKEILAVGAHRKGIVEELEKAHIYIEQLEARIEKLENEFRALKNN